VLSQIPSWAGPLPADILRWLAFRQAPSSSETSFYGRKRYFSRRVRPGRGGDT
jgi:hypothetical protein